MPRRRIVVLLVLALVVAGFMLFPLLSRFLTEWWWFKEVGYQVVFTRQLVSRTLLFLGGGTLTFLVLYLNLRLAQRGVVPNPILLQVGESVPAVNVPAVLRKLALPVALGFGLLGALAASSAWDTVLQAANATPFGINDPVFGRDIGWYVFTLPAISTALGVLSGLATLSLLILVPLYFLRGDIISKPPTIRFERSAGLHLAAIVAVMLVLTALRLWMVDTPGLLYSSTGPLVGASYTDIHARLPAIRVTAVLAVLAAGMVVFAGLRGRLVPHGIWAVAGYIVAALLGRVLFPAAIQKFVVAPTELTRETPYLTNHIAATRQAWGLDSVDTRELDGEANLTLADIRANAPTIENVRLWDREPLLQTFGQLQEIRTYYDFVSVDDDRYMIDGKYRQVLLSPRELNVASLPTRTFINEHLTFTHGMGLTLSPVNQVTIEGLPVLFVRDLPPASEVSLKVTRPQIYFGELANEFVFVGTKQREFDHPAGEANVYAPYEGTGGVPVGNLLRRLVLATSFRSTKILLSGDITSGSRVLYYRNITARAAKALPFLTFDRDPYMVVADDGALQWILDAYTTTSRYPYSSRLADGTSYMRNSVKVVLDAYNGKMRAFVSEPNDPLVRTWEKIFPGVFQPITAMPADLRLHIRYPDDLYRTQATLYTTYHMEAPEDFYHREDQWQIPAMAKTDGSVPFMRHIVMRLPDEPKAEFIYMVPFTPRGKDNLAAWMVARNDGEAYGSLRVYRLSRQSLVFGPQQITNRINQDTEVSRQVSLWDQAGSRVIRGDLLVIPIEQSLLYVQPLYLQAEGGRIPELKRVVVAFQNQVVMRETLDAALAQLFGGSSGGPSAQGRGDSLSLRARGAGEATSGVSAELRALLTEARQRYQAALEAQRAGEWARYGEEIKRLGELLERLARQQ
ncbi:MAG: UPF0182 family protein [Gemmatimonadales bacterium]|nr:UPF0182 family protein [Gemmatimonadales bacterium]